MEAESNIRSFIWPVSRHHGPPATTNRTTQLPKTAPTSRFSKRVISPTSWQADSLVAVAGLSALC